MNVQIPVKWLQELLALCGPEDHELCERVMVSITAMDEQTAWAVAMPVPDERAAFEKWYSNDGAWPQSIERNADGEYTYIPTAVNWNAWKARAALAATPEAASSDYQCADCKAPLRAGYTCDKCDSSAAEEVEATAPSPVVLPEPVAKVEDGGLKWHIPDSGYSLPYVSGYENLYTEQQVRALLGFAFGISTYAQPTRSNARNKP